MIRPFAESRGGSQGALLRRLGLLAVLLVVLAGCGGEERSSPEEVVRAWSRALNVGDNRAAADLFALGAAIEQPGLMLRVQRRSEAVAWHESLPCSGEIVDIAIEGDEATATFLLGNRRTSPCDAPGGHVSALFRVQDGKIVLFRQLPSAAPPPDAI